VGIYLIMRACMSVVCMLDVCCKRQSLFERRCSRVR
jgi:hypothetical protein